MISFSVKLLSGDIICLETSEYCNWDFLRLDVKNAINKFYQDNGKSRSKGFLNLFSLRENENNEEDTPLSLMRRLHEDINSGEMICCYFSDVFPDQETDENLYNMWESCYYE